MSELQSTPSASIVIAATFTVEPLLSPMRFVLSEAALQFDVKCGGYNQLFQELLSPNSLLTANAGGINVILIRMEDFARGYEDMSNASVMIERTGRELLDALRQYQRISNVPTIVSVFGPSPCVSSALVSCLQSVSGDLAEQVQDIPGFQLLTLTEINLVVMDEIYDPQRDELAHIPFSDEFYASVALAVVRKIHALKVPAHKVLVLDCDNTLWRGVVGEDSIDGISISAGFHSVQRFAVEEQTKGVLICLVSKNAEEDVLEVLRMRADMVLKPEHVVAHRINWSSKPENIASLAKELNLALESFVFLDDNPIECAQVRAALPQLVTLQLPPEDEIQSFLTHLWVFDKVDVTSEDARRTLMYRENVARQSLEESVTDIGEFIASLELVIDIASPEEGDWARMAQLTQRTNQFNFTTVRRTEAEMRASKADGSIILRITVRDRFGAYGLVGVIVAVPRGDSLFVDTVLLSCRVLGRGVEHAMLRRLGEIARERALLYVDLLYVRSPKNEPAYAFAENIGGRFKIDAEQREGKVLYRLPCAYACEISHRPGQDPEAVIRARKAEEKKQATVDPSSAVLSVVGGSDHYTVLATSLVSGRAVLDAIRARSIRRRTVQSQLELPATEAERKLSDLWQEILNIDQLGVEDDYFALGGTSLLAARMFAEIARRFGVRLRLTTILESPTVRALARRVIPLHDEYEGQLIELRRGGPDNLFLVHDGDGETLLYLNLARRLPDGLTIFGIEPRRLPRVPLAHTRIEDMAGFYIREIRRRQPHGPYMLGGLCAGGVIAYEMACQLKSAHEAVSLVAILDAAAPRARKRGGLIMKQRVARLEQMLAEQPNRKGAQLTQGYVLARAISRKALNALTWEISSRAKQLVRHIRFYLLKGRLAREKPWPSFFAEFNVREIYDSAEARYIPRTLVDAGVILARARTGTGNDAPYREVYDSDTLGWDLLVPDITAIDVDGGHSSMLQEPFVASLASVLAARIAAGGTRRVVPASAHGANHRLEDEAAIAGG